jgi:transcriptional regulator with XRE-family HTH domain
MSIARKTLRTNLQALMDYKHGPRTQSALHRKSKVAQATIGRILRDSGENARIETDEALAKAYGLDAWQLMVPGMDPANPPVLRSASKEEAELYDRLRDAGLEIVKAPDRKR